MQAGLADIKGWGQYMGAQWCGEGTDIERALEHSNQAVRYLISGKDDCVRKACKVPNPSDPRRCPQPIPCLHSQPLLFAFCRTHALARLRLLCLQFRVQCCIIVGYSQSATLMRFMNCSSC